MSPVRRARKALVLVVALAAGSLVLPSSAHPGHGPDLRGGPTNFVVVSDGTSIALNVVVPDKCNPAIGGTEACPAILEMAGYENGSSDRGGRTTIGQTDDWVYDQFGNRIPNAPLTGDSHGGTSAFRYDDDYVLVHASVRGTGCSAGEFDLFSDRISLDGYEIIEDWIVDNAKHATIGDTARSAFTSNGKVGILGHSYSGITGFLVAAKEGLAKREGRPSSLVSTTVSGLIDDLYRGITYPGGLFNGLFPPLWTLGIRPAYDVLGGTAQGIVRNTANPQIAAQCAKNLSTRSRTVLNDPVVHGLTETDNNWWRSRSLVTYAPLIAHPIHTAGAFQDEQTGPRFAHLWETIAPGVPKRLLMSNGNHGTQVSPLQMWSDRKAWMDYWMRGVAPTGFFNPDDAQKTWVRTLFELHGSPQTASAVKDSKSFPLEDTTWTPYFLSAGGELVSSAGGVTAGSQPYLSGTKRQSWFFEIPESEQFPPFTEKGPDELDFTSDAFTSAQAIDGPITANLFLSSTAPDTGIMVQVADRDDETGTVAILQRGLLKASHRQITARLSDYSAKPDPIDGSKPFMYRAFRPHTNPTNIMPGAVEEYFIEIFPVAHIFRPGHRLQIKIMAPTAIDSYYSYAPKEPPAINQVFFDASRPSRITLPFVPLAGVGGLPELVCGDWYEVRCIKD